MFAAETSHRSLAWLAFVAASIAGCSSESGTQSPPFAPRTTVTTTPPSTAPATTSTTTTSTTIVVPTTTTLPLVTAGGVVKVANATDVDEAAQRLTTQLAELGFAVAEATNAAGKDEELSVSKIYVSAGSEDVAASISYLMGGIEVLRMPTPAWIFGGTAALGAATVLVMLGSDLATTPLHVMRFEPGRQGPD